MPLLDRNGVKPDIWTKCDGAAIDNLSHALVHWSALSEALRHREHGQRIATLVPNTVRIDDIAPLLGQLDLVAIDFPAYSDGRGFSLARQIRNHGFPGTLRVSGPLISDQFAYALACGFDEVELPEALALRQPPEHWITALDRISHGYQRGYGDRLSILDQRRAARTAR